MAQQNSLAPYLQNSKIPEFLNCNRIAPNHSRHCSFLPHAHVDRLELFYLAEGEVTYLVDGYTYPLVAGDLVICNQGVVHGDSWLIPAVNNGYYSYSVAFQGVTFIGMPENTLDYGTADPILKMGNKNSEAAHLFKSLHTLSNSCPSAELTCQSLALSILLLAYRQLIFQKESPPSIQKSNRERIQRDVCTTMRQYMDQNFREALTLACIGQTFNASEFYLAHLFKDRYDISPMKYLLKRRLGEAQTCLIETEYPVAFIAESVNAGSPAHFSSIFNKYIGLSPSTYRKNFKSMNVN